MSDGMPVHDEGAEQATLAALMIEGSFSNPHDRWKEISHMVSASDFFINSNRRIFEAITALHKAGTVVDMQTVMSELKARERLIEAGGVAYLCKISDAAPTPERAMDYASIVSKKAKQRGLASLGQRIAAEGRGDVGDVDEWASRCDLELRAVAQGGISKAPYEAMGAVIKKELRAIEDGWRNGVPPKQLTTGLASLDKVFTMTPGDLVIVAARPGMGKTAFVGGVSTWVANSDRWLEEHRSAWHDEDAGAIVFTQEMPRGQIALRCLCSEAKIDLSALRRGQMQGGDWNALTASAQSLSALPLWVDDKSGITLDYVRRTVHTLKREIARGNADMKLPRGLRMVVIDYLQLMRFTGRKDATKSELVGDVTRGLKQMAKEEDLVVVLLSQLNRSLESRDNKRPVLSDLRDSGEIEQDADSVLFLYRDGYYNRDCKNPDIAEVIIAKQRNGSPGRVPVRWTGAYTLFSELSDDEKASLQREAEDARKVKTTKALNGGKSW